MYRCEFVCSGFGMLPGQLAHESTLAHGGEAYEANTGDTSPGDIETHSSTSSTAAGLEQLSLEFCKFCLQLSFSNMSNANTHSNQEAVPRWKDVALFFCVLAICIQSVSHLVGVEIWTSLTSASMSLI